MDRKDFKAKPYHTKVKNNGDIERIIHPSNTDVGTEKFSADLRVFGSGTFTNNVTAVSGVFTGDIAAAGRITASLVAAPSGVFSITQAVSGVFTRVTDQYGNELATSGRPDSFGGLLMWMEADPAYVSLDTSSGTTTVQRWVDLSGNNRHFSQGTKAQQPFWESNPFLSGSTRGLGFRAGQVMSATSVALSTFTLVIGMQCKNNSALLVEHGADLNSNDGHWIFGGNLGSGSTILVRRNGGSLCGKNMTSPTWMYDNGYPCTLIMQHEGTPKLLQFYINNVMQNQMTEANTTSLFSLATTASLYLGARSNLQAPFSGSVFAFALYTPAIRPEQAMRVAKYFGTKFGAGTL